ncbi:MAG: ester cyclase [Mucilaginibacter sp.]|jgi:predicted SnoaL-like aldol condensation-catalyzing enzyme|uniref:ester cyclase n=1 Tax=Mucilaginibacter sp. TaxID=1882438 RepID=UPI0035644F50
MKTLKITLFAFLMAATSLVSAQGKMAEKDSEVQKNKEAVIKFNEEYWASGNIEITKELLADNYVNHFAPPNGPNGRTLMVGLMTGFKKGFSNVSVEFTEVIGEGDIVSTVKTITATHTGEFMGKAATGKKITINIVETDVLKNGKITDAWSMSNFQQVMQAL